MAEEPVSTCPAIRCYPPERGLVMLTLSSSGYNPTRDIGWLSGCKMAPRSP
jgi:hypothetical protein